MLALSDAELEVLWLSLRVSTVAVAASLPVAVALAIAFARRDFPGKRLAEGVVYLPLVLPPVVTGYVLLLLLGRNGPLGEALYDAFGVTLAFRWTGAAVAAAVMGFPLMVRAIRLSVEAIDRRLERAARTLGAGRARVFFTITLPLALPGILAGTVLSFGRSLGEFGATITFVSNIPGETRTLPLAIYALTQVPGGDVEALRLVAISVALSLLALLGSEWLGRHAALWRGAP
ncbi:MAG TPA: molybdate ABC transporter permease subunit [Stellaceae bacterium]|nr:molybdate ABC transporter permease subunit [Stellaceae bacterium]